MKALFDGDYLVYRHAFAVEKEYNDYGPLTAEWNLGYNLIKCIDDILNKIGTEEYRVFLSGTTNYRNELTHVDYKANRKDARKPSLYKEARQIIQDHLNHKVVEGIEADDALGIHQTKDTVIVTIDKDLRMIPGKHYDLKTGRVWKTSSVGNISKKVTQTKKKGRVTKIKSTGFAHFCLQMITGDTVDNIPGIPGMGPVKAFNVLEHCISVDEYWDAVTETYKEKELSEDYMYDQADALWIMRKDKQFFRDWLKLNYK